MAILIRNNHQDIHTFYHCAKHKFTTLKKNQNLYLFSVYHQSCNSENYFIQAFTALSWKSLVIKSRILHFGRGKQHFQRLIRIVESQRHWFNISVWIFCIKWKYINIKRYSKVVENFGVKWAACWWYFQQKILLKLMVKVFLMVLLNTAKNRA